MTMAPTTDIRNPAPSLGPYQPIVRPNQPASSAPQMPSRMVMMKPPGSRPGMRSFATTPTIRPKRIQPRIPTIPVPSHATQRANGATSAEDFEVLQGAAGIEEDDGLVGLDRAAGGEPLDGHECRAAFRRGADPLVLADRQHA